ncbi:MAG: rRNA maturation RNase YbeY [Phycisphaerales bacterium]|nr:rRNA maturation RNase YbeY [Phycisphaerales bacterium]
MDDEPSSSPRQSGNTEHTLDVEISDTDRLLDGVVLDWLRKASGTVFQRLKSRGEIRVRLVDDASMCKAHAQYCGLDSTADVLTFDLAPGETLENKVLDTDLIVCVDEASRQAANRAHRVEHELLLYILHGVLHCLGYDDHSDEAFARMHAREDELLDESGYGKLFSAPYNTMQKQSAEKEDQS